MITPQVLAEIPEGQLFKAGGKIYKRAGIAPGALSSLPGGRPAFVEVDPNQLKSTDNVLEKVPDFWTGIPGGREVALSEADLTASGSILSSKYFDTSGKIDETYYRNDLAGAGVPRTVFDYSQMRPVKENYPGEERITMYPTAIQTTYDSDIYKQYSQMRPQPQTTQPTTQQTSALPQATPQSVAQFQQIQTDFNKIQEQAKGLLETSKVDLNNASEVKGAVQKGQTPSQDFSDLETRFKALEMASPPEFQSLTNTLNNILTQQGVPPLQAEAIDLENIIDGTEDDIRAEMQKGGGWISDSQILALTEVRNKTLIKRYNRVLDRLKVAQGYVDTIMGLTKEDRKNQIDAFNTKYNIAKNALETDIKMKQLGITETKEYKDNMQKQMTTMADNWGDYPQQVRNQVWQGAGFVGEAPVTLGGGQEWVKYWENGDLYQTSSKTGKTDLIKSADKTTTSKLLTVPEIEDLRFQYPDISFGVGDTFDSANVKITASLAPKAVDLTGITFNGLTVKFKDGSSWIAPDQKTLDQFKKDNGITGSEPTATSAPVFGTGNFTNINITDRVSQLKLTLGNTATDAYLEQQLIKDGYPASEITKITRTGLQGIIANLFGR